MTASESGGFGGKFAIEDSPYSDSLLDRLVHALDGVVRERYERPGEVQIEWRDRAWEVDRESITARGIQLKRDEWLRIELEDSPDRDRTFREIDLENVWNCWIVDADGSKRLLHSHNDDSYSDWKADHPNSFNSEMRDFYKTDD